MDDIRLHQLDNVFRVSTTYSWHLGYTTASVIETLCNSWWITTPSFLTIQYSRPLIGKLLSISGTKNIDIVKVCDLNDRYCAEERYILRVTLYSKRNPVSKACDPETLASFESSRFIANQRYEIRVDHGPGNEFGVYISLLKGCHIKFITYLS